MSLVNVFKGSRGCGLFRVVLILYFNIGYVKNYMLPVIFFSKFTYVYIHLTVEKEFLRS